MATFATIEGIGSCVDTSRRVAIRTALHAGFGTLANAGFGVADRIGVASDIRGTAMVVVVGITLSFIQIMPCIACSRLTGAIFADRNFAIGNVVVTSIAVGTAVFDGVRFTNRTE